MIGFLKQLHVKFTINIPYKLIYFKKMSFFFVYLNMSRFYYDVILGLVWWEFKEPLQQKSKKRKKNKNN